MYRAEEFKAYFLNEIGAKPNSLNTYNSFLNRIDRAIGGLDEKIQKDGIDSVLSWSKTTNVGPFETYPSHARSVVKRYIQFVLSSRSDDDEDEDNVLGEDEESPASGLVFRLEREMQAAVRKQLEMLEPGLNEADGGSEIALPTGRPDIVAEDENGTLVVIELKAGACPSGALEQVLGYAEALSEDRGKPVRAYLVASEFSDRIRAAAKRVRDLELRTYEFSMQFHSVL